MLARLRELPPDIRDIRPEISAETAELVSRMLEPDPAKRYPNYTSLLSDFETVMDTVRSKKLKEQQDRQKSSNKMKWLLWLLPVLLLLGGGWFFMKGGDPLFSQEQEQELISLIERWTQNQYRYDPAALHTADDSLSVFEKQLPPDDIGRLWVHLIQSSIQQLARNSNRVEQLLLPLAGKEQSATRSDKTAIQSYVRAQALARSLLSTNPAALLQHKNMKMQPAWYRESASYFVAVTFIYRGEYAAGSQYLKAYGSTKAEEQEEAWAYSFRPMANDLYDQIRKWDARRERIKNYLKLGYTNKAAETIRDYKSDVQPALFALSGAAEPIDTSRSQLGHPARNSCFSNNPSCATRHPKNRCCRADAPAGAGRESPP